MNKFQALILDKNLMDEIMTYHPDKNEFSWDCIHSNLGWWCNISTKGRNV